MSSVSSIAIPDRLYLNEIMTDRENQQVEFKPSFAKKQLSTYRKTLNAFLNTDGGILYFGISDRGLIHGVYTDSKSEDAFRLWVDNTQNSVFVPPPQNHLTVKVFKLTKTISVLAIVVKKSAVPISYDRHFYYRSNASTTLVRDARQLQLQPNPSNHSNQWHQQQNQMDTLKQELQTLQTLQTEYQNKLHQYQLEESIHNKEIKDLKTQLAQLLVDQKQWEGENLRLIIENTKLKNQTWWQRFKSLF